MTETPGRPSDPPPEPNSDETTEPTPAATGEAATEPTPAATREAITEPTPAATSAPTAEMTGTAPRTADSSARWRWLKNPNRIAASVAIIAGAVAVVAAVFTSGFVVGAHAGGEHHDRWRQHSEMSAGREHTPPGKIWIIPGRGHDAFIVAGSGTGVYDGSD
ncbi:hypothetical protein [Mycobacterium sp.]|uniref:hypothetical protein n=1 Tax=Mycobacterium sp. TaxID=1785 RepID=UPI002D319F8E|nr:hypothetical protein [Mycobacterium sp.]HZA12264.1 hypothetical protein [Mycobacterium sp.]